MILSGSGTFRNRHAEKYAGSHSWKYGRRRGSSCLAAEKDECRSIMGKALYIAEKPSVAQEFAKALKINGQEGTAIWNQRIL